MNKAFVDKRVLAHFLETNPKKFTPMVNQIYEEGVESHDGVTLDKDDWDDLQVDYGLKECRGVGDVIAKVIKKVTRIKPCGGCKSRRRKWNQ